MALKIKFWKVGQIVVLVFSLFSLPLAAVWKKSKTAELLREVGGLEKKAQSARLRNLDLHCQRDRLLSRERIEAVALRELGMIYPPLKDVVVLEKKQIQNAAAHESVVAFGE